jgi:ribonuclease P protein component
LARSGDGFPKAARLRRRSEFLAVSRDAAKSYTSHFVVLSKRGAKEESRLGITVSAKVGNAVVRNRIKRSVREFFRRHRRSLRSARDYVVIARKGAERLKPEEVAAELLGVIAYRNEGRGSA